jgi:DNA ligase-1
MRTLYKVDENENVRTWSMETDGPNFRTHSGVLDGKIVVSGWKTAKAKNVGRANATTPEEQAVLEVDRKYLDQLETGGYYETIEAAREGVTAYFDCMLAHRWGDEKHRVTFPVYEQPKLDGIRCIATVDGLKTRNGKRLVATPHIEEQLERLHRERPRVTLDGELYNHELKADFEQIVSLVRRTKPDELDFIKSREMVQYHVYDVYDADRPGLTTGQRSRLLYELFEEYFGELSHVRHVEAHLVYDQEALDECYGNHIEDGYEGQMVRLDAPYEQKRSRNLLKRKEFEDAEFRIERVESGVGNWNGYAKRVYVRLEDETVQRAGTRGNQPFLKKVLEDADSYVGTEVTVRFQNRTADGKLRFPVVTKFWHGARDL